MLVDNEELVDFVFCFNDLFVWVVGLMVYSWFVDGWFLKWWEVFFECLSVMWVLI